MVGLRPLHHCVGPFTLVGAVQAGAPRTLQSAINDRVARRARRYLQRGDGIEVNGSLTLETADE